MRKFTIVFVACVAVAALIVGDALARGGGGGGVSRGGGGFSGGGGGYSRPSPAVSRSPSMSRPATPSISRPSTGGISRPNTGAIPSRPTTGQRPATRPQPGTIGVNRPAGGIGQGQRPSPSQLNNFLDLPSQGAARPNAGGGARPAGGNAAVADFLHGGGTTAGNRADNIADRTGARSDVRDSRGENRDFASDNRQDRVAGRGDQQAVRVADRGEMRSSLADGRGERRTERQQQLGDHADQVRDELRQHYDDNHLFDDFWIDHAHYRFHQNPVFWTWASFNTVRAFLPWNWGTAAYYDYGSGGNVYYEGDTVYAAGTAVPAQEYAAQAEQIATTVPEVEKPDEMEWLPLGVFALSQDGNENAVPNMFLQLAVSKEGIIAGTYQNKTTEQTESVEGMVDQKTQRAAWTVVDKNTPIIETGISNLTMNESRVLVHFADGQTQQWLLIRVSAPEGEEAPQ
ncbi:MAG: hypothetical protein ACI9G1_001694 [Pirellulaceae bacterium]|jgi:hypothetical protein